MLICAQRLLMSLEFPLTAYPCPISFHIAPLRCGEGKGHSEQCSRKKAARPQEFLVVSEWRLHRSSHYAPTPSAPQTFPRIQFFILFLFFFFREGAVSRNRNPHSLGPVLGHALHAPLSVKRSTCGIAYFRSLFSSVFAGPFACRFPGFF